MFHPTQEKANTWAQMMEDDNGSSEHEDQEDSKHRGSQKGASRKNSENIYHKEGYERKPHMSEFVMNMIKIIEETPAPITVYVFNIAHKATEEDVRKIYSEYNISKCSEWDKGRFTLELDDKEEAIKLVKGGRKFFKGELVKIRIPRPREDNEEGGIRQRNQQRRTDYNSGRKNNDHPPRNGRPNYNRKKEYQDENDGENRSFNKNFNKFPSDRPHYNNSRQNKRDERPQGEENQEQTGPQEERKPMGFFKKEHHIEKKEDASATPAKPNPFGQAKPRTEADIARTEAEVQKLMEEEGLSKHPNPEHQKPHENKIPHENKPTHHESKGAEHHQENKHHHYEPKPHHYEPKPHQQPPPNVTQQEQTKEVESKEEAVVDKPKTYQNEKNQGGPRHHNKHGDSQQEFHSKPRYGGNRNYENKHYEKKESKEEDDGFTEIKSKKKIMEEKKQQQYHKDGHKHYKPRGEHHGKQEKRYEKTEKPQPEVVKPVEVPKTLVVEDKGNTSKQPTQKKPQVNNTKNVFTNLSESDENN